MYSGAVLVQRVLSESTVAKALSRVPPFPPIATQVLALLSSDSVEISDLSKLIGSDPTFSAGLLQCVNSYEFGLARPVIAVPQAIMFLGLERARQVIVTLAAGAYASGGLKASALRRSWEHSVATAILADELARACEAFRGGAYTAGIMHDIGRLGLLVAYPNEYELVIRRAADQCVDLLEFERERFGMHHAEAGRLLMERWGLPDELRIVAGRHHDHCEGEEVDLLRIIHVACRLADVLGYSVTGPSVSLDFDSVLAELPARARARFPASPDHLRAQIDQRLRTCDSKRSDEQAEAPALELAEVCSPQGVSFSAVDAPRPSRRSTSWLRFFSGNRD